MFLQCFVEFLDIAAPVAAKDTVLQTVRCQCYTPLEKEEEDFINLPRAGILELLSVAA